jgi:hypothetical protein
MNSDSSLPTPSHRRLNIRPELALSQNKMSGMILLCYENDRPLKGMLGYLDWRFNGHFSRLVREQVITGKLNETVYVPLAWNSQTYHFLIAGGGPIGEKKAAKALLDSAILKMNALKLTNMGISEQDWSLKQEVPNLWILN